MRIARIWSKERIYYVLIYKAYVSYDVATQAANALCAATKLDDCWPRKVGHIYDGIRSAELMAPLGQR